MPYDIEGTKEYPQSYAQRTKRNIRMKMQWILSLKKKSWSGFKNINFISYQSSTKLCHTSSICICSSRLC